ncbi:unnamed protein product [Blepharisma stoltei]|uniref:Uncharacterized protein n=1 Tax=Blepharisma stoltei TaxID=1481888 RepID=A0AAU9JL19_9CILI|nr:unnamed protein product [Blepharisma stoltei]
MRLSSIQLNQFKFSAAFEKYNKFISENPTLEQILENPSTPDQITVGSKILISYLTPEMVRQLLTFITVEPSESDSPARIHTYPFVSSLFFSVECGALLDLVHSDQTLLENLLNFLKGDAPLNFLLSGYFAKAFDILMRSNERKLLDFFYSQNYHFFLLNHIYSQSIADIAYKCLSSSFTFKQQRTEIIDILVSKLTVDYSPLVALNSQNIICRALNDCFPGIEYLANEAVISSFFQNLKSENREVVTSSAKVLLSIFAAFKEESSISLKFLLQIETIRDLIFKVEKTLKNQAGCEATIIGETKLVIMQIINILCGAHLPEVGRLFKVAEIIPKLTELFESHDWNSLLHERYFNIVESIIYSDSQDLQIALLEDAKLPQLLIRLGNSPYVQYGRALIKRGSMGYVYKIANLLISSKNKGIIEDEVINKIEGWASFEKEIVEVYNRVANSELGAIYNFESASSEGNNETESSNLPVFTDSDNAQIEPISSVSDAQGFGGDETASEYFENVYWKVEFDLNELEEI